jgi:hypothetical protein
MPSQQRIDRRHVAGKWHEGDVHVRRALEHFEGDMLRRGRTDAGVGQRAKLRACSGQIVAQRAVRRCAVDGHDMRGPHQHTDRLEAERVVAELAHDSVDDEGVPRHHSVLPSGAARATASVPITEPAPGLFSTIADTPCVRLI